MINTQKEYEAVVKEAQALEALLIAAKTSGRLAGRRRLYLKLLILQTDIHEWEATGG